MPCGPAHVSLHQCIILCKTGKINWVGGYKMTVSVTLAETSLMLSLLICLFLSVSKTPPHSFPLSVSIDILVSVFYLLVIAQRERERDKWPGKKLVTEEAGGPFKEWQPLLLVEPKESGSFSAYAFFSFWF